MTEFFAKAGKMISHSIQELGSFPVRKFVSVFTHENGVAMYDGNDWSFKLNS